MREMEEKKRLAVDFEGLQEAFEEDADQVGYYLDLDTGTVESMTDEFRWELRRIYTEIGDDSDDAKVLEAIHQRTRANWHRETLITAHQIESSYGTRFVAVPRDETRVAYEDMVAFIPTVRSARLQERLEEAIDGRGAFSRFQRVLEDAPHERKHWLVFKKARVRERIVEWLADEGIEAVPMEPDAGGSLPT